MDIPENWIHSPGIFPYPGNGDNRYSFTESTKLLWHCNPLPGNENGIKIKVDEIFKLKKVQDFFDYSKIRRVVE